MKTVLFEEYDEEQRRQALEDNCDSITTQSFLKRSTQAEIQMLRKRNSEIDIQLGIITLDEKLMREKIKNRRTPLLKEKDEIITQLKAGGRYVEGKVYKFIDREANQVLFYDDNGNLVEQRRMTAEDRQCCIKFKTGTE